MATVQFDSFRSLDSATTYAVSVNGGAYILTVHSRWYVCYSLKDCNRLEAENGWISYAYVHGRVSMNY